MGRKGWLIGAGVVAVGVGVLVVVTTRKTAAIMAPREIRELLAEIFGTGPIPLWFALTNAKLESGFNPQADLRTAREDSFGLFMINWRAHRATLEARGISQGDLLEPRINATYWRDVVRTFKAGAVRRGYTGDAMWEAVRLRLAGIRWDDFGGATARGIASRFWATAGRFR